MFWWTGTDVVGRADAAARFSRCGSGKPARGRRVTGLALALAMLGACLLLVAGRGAAQDSGGKPETRASEYEIKAAYLYNFLLFVHWPEDPDKSGAKKPASDGAPRPYTIAILGKDPFDKAFAPVEGRPIKGTSSVLAIERLGSFDPTMDLSRYRVLFVASSEKRRFKEILEKVGSASVLTVADSEGFLEDGGMVNLLPKSGKIRWEINQGAVESHGLRMDAQLFQSASRVIPAPSEKKTAPGEAPGTR